MRRFSTALVICLIIFAAALSRTMAARDSADDNDRGKRNSVEAHARELVREGRQIFRFDTLCDYTTRWISHQAPAATTSSDPADAKCRRARGVALNRQKIGTSASETAT